MKIQSSVPSAPADLRSSSALALAGALLLSALPALSLSATAAEAEAQPEAAGEKPKGEKPPPLPLHNIEGNGGIFSTLSAYIVNPPRDGEVLGRPSVGFSYVHIGYGRSLEAITATESPWKRLELGYGYNHFDLGDLQAAVAPTDIVDSTSLHNFNARLQLLKEGEFDTKWVPAVTAGVHYKYNDGISQLNDQLGGALKGIGIEGNDGIDVTLYASKLFTFLPRPVLLNLGGRATRGAWNGYAGFTENYSFQFEGNLVVFVTDRLALAAEYRQQPTDYTAIPLVKESGDWWTIDAAYVVSSHFTVAVGYGHFGGVVNHDANGVWGVTTKWEF